MRREEVVTIPGFWFAGKQIVPPTTELRVILNKRERETLRRAARICEEARALVDPEGDEEWTVAYEALSCAESWVREVANFEHFEPNDWQDIQLRRTLDKLRK